MFKLPARDEVKVLKTVHHKPNILRQMPSTPLPSLKQLVPPARFGLLEDFPYLGVPYQALNNLIGLKVRLLV